jgi:hypothetical protein
VKIKVISALRRQTTVTGCFYQVADAADIARLSSDKNNNVASKVGKEEEE